MSKRLRNTVDQDPILSDEIFRKLYENSTSDVSLSKADQDAVQILALVMDYLNQST